MSTATLKKPTPIRPAPAPPKRVRSRTTRKAPAVVAQVRSAVGSPIALALGCILGGFVPLASYVLAHLPAPAWYLWALVAGGLLFSAKTVYQWGAAAFADAWKAGGFVLLLEGVMTYAPVPWLALSALGVLVGINAIATGCALAGVER